MSSRAVVGLGEPAGEGDERGGLEADGEREVEAERPGGGDGGEAPLGGGGEVAGGKKSLRKHGADQRKFPFDA